MYGYKLCIGIKKKKVANFIAVANFFPHANNNIALTGKTAMCCKVLLIADVSVFSDPHLIQLLK